MFRIADGRECFYQWDLDRQIIVDDETITEVHFCNRTGDCSLVVEVESLEIFADFKPISVLRTANVPNVLLQSSFDIRVFGYDGKATLHDEVFKVKARTKPSDYVYTEVEIKRYEDLNKRIEEIEKEGVSQEAVDNAVNRYLEENPIGDVPTKVSQLENDSNYATETYVDTAISNIPEVDLSKHALKSEVPTKVSQLTNDSKFITREEVPETDLSEYAKKSDIPNVSDFITSIPSEYITESELNAKGYSTFSGRYSDLIGKPDIPSVDGLAPVTYVDQKFNSIDLAPYAIKAEVAQTYAKKSDIPKDYLKEVPAEYITENELAAKDYASKTYVADAIAGMDIPEAASDCRTYFFDPRELVFDKGYNNTSAAVSDHVAEFATKLLEGESVNLVIYDEELDRYLPAEFVLSNDSITVARTFSRADVSAKRTAIHWLLTYKGSDGWWVREASESAVQLASTDYVDNAIANIDLPEAESQKVYNVVLPTSKNSVVTDADTIEFLDKCLAGEHPIAFDDDFLITRVQKGNVLNSEKIILSYATNAILGTASEIYYDYSFIKKDGSWTLEYYTETSRSYSADYATKTYVDNAIAELEIPEEVNLDDYYTKAEVDNAIANIDIPEVDPVDLSNYYTKSETYNKTEVDNKIAAINTGGGGSGGESKTQIVIVHNNFTDEVKALLREAHAYGQSANVLDKYDIFYVVQNYSNTEYAQVTSVAVYQDRLQMTAYTRNTQAVELFWYSSSNSLYINNWYYLLTSDNYSEYISSGGGGGGDWLSTTDSYDYNLYNAREICVIFEAVDWSGNCISSYVNLGDETLGGNWTYKYFQVPLPDGETGYWFYDGEHLSNPSNYPVVKILYKT